MNKTYPRGGRRSVPHAKSNGAARAPHAAGAMNGRHNGRTAPARASRARSLRGESKLAGFISVDRQASGAPMWPVHPVVWFQPELKPFLPSSSGLTIETYRPLPAPDFLRLEVSPADQAHRPDEVSAPLAPKLEPQLPPSRLAPSGWDPRSLSEGSRRDVQIAGEAAGFVSPDLKREVWK